MKYNHTEVGRSARGGFYTARSDTRPWPVDPRQYPLSGPSSGPVYCPEIGCGTLVAVWLACGLGGFLGGAALGFGWGLIRYLMHR